MKKKFQLYNSLWQNASIKVESDETIDVLHTLFDYILDTLYERIDDARTVYIMLYFFSNGRHIISITVCKKNLQVNIHHPSGDLFEQEANFKVERFKLWQTSFVKSKGKFRGSTAWVSKIAHIEGMKEILRKMPEKVE
ncbi:MAG: hypothetical protein ACUVWP_03395 [bacterium]